MRRIATEVRPDWKKKAEEVGFMFHTSDGKPYWDESVYYEFTSSQVDEIESATSRLNEMCLLAVEYVVNNRMFENFDIPEQFHSMIVESWQRDEITIYGRFDLAWDGVTGSPKMLEYNADTPTGLLEAAVVQHKWLEELHPTRDQFNTIHDRIVEAWRRLKDEYELGKIGDIVHFASLNNWEDVMTTTYLRDTAKQAGLTTDFLYIKDIGWNERRQCFTDKSERKIDTIFKLYPYEWMVREEFGSNLLKSSKGMRWLEPAWKMLLSNKALLPTLWKLFPNSPYLLESSFSPLQGPHVKKPFLSREGANVQLEDEDGAIFKTDGIYGEGNFIYQRYHRLANIDGYYAVIGSWMCNGWSCGMGIREDESPITGNTSRFVPHLF